jgi:3-oxoacyl-[acyl-carrier protein] reductase
MSGIKTILIDLRSRFISHAKALTKLLCIYPFKEYGQPKDNAEAILILASEKSRYITGEILDVNGGLVMD